MPCGWSSSWQVSHPSSSLSCHLTSPLSPCGTCGSGMSLVHCSVAVSVRQAGHWSPEGLQREPWSLSWGCPGRTAMAAIASSTAAGLAVRACSRFLGDEPHAHLLVVMQGGGQYEGLLQALPTPIAGVVVCYDDMVEV